MGEKYIRAVRKKRKRKKTKDEKRRRKYQDPGPLGDERNRLKEDHKTATDEVQNKIKKRSTKRAERRKAHTTRLKTLTTAQKQKTDARVKKAQKQKNIELEEITKMETYKADRPAKNKALKAEHAARLLKIDPVE